MVSKRHVSYRDFIQVGHEMKGMTNCQRTFIEALDIVCEQDLLFPKENFINAILECLHANGIIKAPSFMDLCLLDSKIMSKFGRNYRMKDLLDAVASFYMIRETFPRTQLELTNNVSSS